MDSAQLLSAVSAVGFPIVVALYVLMRLENTLKENTRAIQQQAEVMGRLVLLLSRIIPSGLTHSSTGELAAGALSGLADTVADKDKLV